MGALAPLGPTGPMSRGSLAAQGAVCPEIAGEATSCPSGRWLGLAWLWLGFGWLFRISGFWA